MELKAHRCGFFNYIPQAINCLAYDELTKTLAVSRSDGSIEIWSSQDNWYQEKIIPGYEGKSVEALVWVNGRLFSAGLRGDVTEYDLEKIRPKVDLDSFGGAVWCLSANHSKSHIAVGTEDGSVRLFDVTESGFSYDRAFTKQDKRILSLAWHESDDVIVTGSVDNIRVWNTHTGHAVQRITLDRVNKNQEIIVWCVAINKDFTIVSGDSAGRTRFWNGRQGTLLQSYQCHRMDVLSLCLNREGTAAFSSGVEPKVVQFDLAEVEGEGPQATLGRRWVPVSRPLQLHTHDVRALTRADQCLVSGGVDTFLSITPLVLTKGQNRQQVREGLQRKIPPWPHTPLVGFAAGKEILLFQHQTFLELWRLGSAAHHTEKKVGTLPLAKNPVKLLQLKAKGVNHIVCSALSRCAEWIAYSDTTALRMFHFAADAPSITKVSHMPAAVEPASRMVFTGDSSRLVSASSLTHRVQVLAVDGLKPALLHSLTSDPADPVHLLAVSDSGAWLAVGDLGNKVNVYSLSTYQHQCQLPVHASRPCALAFSRCGLNMLAVAHCDQKLFEYDVGAKEYTAFSRRLNGGRQLHTRWTSRSEKILHLSYSPFNPNQILLRSFDIFTLLDRTKPPPTTKDKIWYSAGLGETQVDKNKRGQKHGFKICNRYQSLLFMDYLEAHKDWFVVVEKSPNSLLDQLQPALRVKKFGT